MCSNIENWGCNALVWIVMHRDASGYRIESNHWQDNRNRIVRPVKMHSPNVQWLHILHTKTHPCTSQVWSGPSSFCVQYFNATSSDKGEQFIRDSICAPESLTLFLSEGESADLRFSQQTAESLVSFLNISNRLNTSVGTTIWFKEISK